jgi:hypothetical protein
MNVLARTAFKLFNTEPMTDEKVRTLVEAVVLSGVRFVTSHEPSKQEQLGIVSSLT